MDVAWRNWLACSVSLKKLLAGLDLQAPSSRPLHFGFLALPKYLIKDGWTSISCGRKYRSTSSYLSQYIHCSQSPPEAKQAWLPCSWLKLAVIRKQRSLFDSQGGTRNPHILGFLSRERRGRNGCFMGTPVCSGDACNCGAEWACCTHQLCQAVWEAEVSHFAWKYRWSCMLYIFE